MLHSGSTQPITPNGAITDFLFYCKSSFYCLLYPNWISMLPFFPPLLGALVILTVPFLYKTHSIPQALSSPHLLSATGSPKTCVGPLYPTSSSHQEETHKQTWAALELGNRNGLDARLMVITSLDARLMVITSTTIRGYIHMSFIISVCGTGDRMGSQ